MTPRKAIEEPGMKLSEVIAFVQENNDLLDELKSTAGEVLDAAKAEEIQNACDRAAAFLNELESDGGVPVEIDDAAQRSAALDAEIARLEAERDATPDPNERVSPPRKILFPDRMSGAPPAPGKARPAKNDIEPWLHLKFRY